MKTEKQWAEMKELLDKFFESRKHLTDTIKNETGSKEILAILSDEELRTLQRVERLLNEMELEEILETVRKKTETDEEQNIASQSSTYQEQTYMPPPVYYPWGYGYYGASMPYPPPGQMVNAQAQYQNNDPRGPAPEQNLHPYTEKNVSEEQAFFPQGKGNRTGKIISNILFYLVLVIVVLGTAVFALSQNTEKNILGYRFYNVLTSSMEPKLNVGDLIFVKVLDSTEIETGDVITYNPTQDTETYLTHQVEEVIDNYEDSGVPAFRTRGIANDSPDPYVVTDDMLIGKVIVAAPHGGTVMSYVRDNIWIIIILVVLVSILSVLIRNIFSKKFTTLLGQPNTPADTTTTQ